MIGAWPMAIERALEEERDQLVLWIPVGLGLGIAAWFCLPDATAWAAAILLALGAATAGLASAGEGRCGRSVAVFGFVAALGVALIWWRAERVAAPVLDRPVVARIEAIVERVERRPAQERIRVLLAPIAQPALPRRVRVNIDGADRPGFLVPGARIELRARLMPPASAVVPGAYDFARVAWFQGIGATGRSIGPPSLVAPPPPSRLSRSFAATRDGLTAHVQSRLPGSEGGIAAALATGDQGGIAEEDAEAMRRSGLAHLLSISGLHVTAVVGLVFFVSMRLLALSPTLALRLPLPVIAAGMGALAAVGYTLLSGAEVPTIRSCIAALLVLIGLALGRDAITLRMVAAGALFVLMLWPEALAGPSFQLSFAAVTAIVAIHEHPGLKALLARREEGIGARAGRFMLGLLITGIAVELALTPIALFHFHRSGLYGALANIVAIPLTTFIVMPLELIALLLDAIGLGAPAWWLAGHALAVLLGIARFVGNAPGAVAALPSMPGAAYALMVAGGVWIALWRTRLRRFGMLPLAAGAAWALATPPPDLLITGDGRHAALLGAGGELALLRPRAGDYVRDTLAENSGRDAVAIGFGALPGARCGRDLCAVELERRGRRWSILATRSGYLVDARALAQACADADIVVSDRRLPAGCRPRWLKADRALLARTGGMAIRLSVPDVITVAERAGHHPWGGN